MGTVALRPKLLVPVRADRLAIDEKKIGQAADKPVAETADKTCAQI